MSDRRRAVNGFAWVAVERFGQQAIQIAVILVLARLLEPEEFGLIAMVTILLSVSQSLVDSGMGQALIRLPEITTVQRSTVFWFNAVVSVALFAVVYASAPWVAAFYEQPPLTDLIRFLALVIPLNALGLIQRTDLNQRMSFKDEALAQVPAMAVAGATAITLAYMGAGVWALAIEQVVLAGLSSLILWIRVRSDIRFLWDTSVFRDLFGFGYRLMLSGLIDTFFKDINKLVFGKAFGAATLGFYAQARKLQDLSTQNLVSIIKKVTYPILSQSGSPDRLASDYRKVVFLSSIGVIPLSAVLVLASEPVVLALLGQKWSFSAEILRITAISGMFYHLHAVNLNVLKVMGRSDLVLRLEIIKKANIALALVIGVPLGFMPLLWLLVAASFVALIINTWYTDRLIGYGIAKQILDVGQVGLLVLPMAVFLSVMQQVVRMDEVPVLAMVVAAAMILYAATIRLIRNEASDLVFRLAEPYLQRLRLGHLSRTP
jgi:O-antigen/teichoic acid export membrane protein